MSFFSLFVPKGRLSYVRLLSLISVSHCLFRISSSHMARTHASSARSRSERMLLWNLSACQRKGNGRAKGVFASSLCSYTGTKTLLSVFRCRPLFFLQDQSSFFSLCWAHSGSLFRLNKFVFVRLSFQAKRQQHTLNLLQTLTFHSLAHSPTYSLAYPFFSTAHPL